MLGDETWAYGQALGPWLCRVNIRGKIGDGGIQAASVGRGEAPPIDSDLVDQPGANQQPLEIHYGIGYIEI